MTAKAPPSSDSVPDKRTVTTAANSEPEEETSGSDTSIHRRSYLKLLGVSTVPLAAGRAEAAETDSDSDSDYGYGCGGYGEGGYGGVADETDGTAEPAEPVAPSVVTESATDIADSAATLHGTVSDLGDADAVDCYFEFREFDSDVWSTTEVRRLTMEGSCSVRVENLDGETRYEYRVLAASDDTTGTGETLSFVTEAGEIGEPVIESLTLSDTNSPSPHVDLQVEWSVSHDADVLSEVQLIVRNDNDRLVDGSTIAVDGAQASGSETFTIKHGSGEGYVVTLLVSDQAGNTEREDATIQT